MSEAAGSKRPWSALLDVWGTPPESQAKLFRQYVATVIESHCLSSRETSHSDSEEEDTQEHKLTSSARQIIEAGWKAHIRGNDESSDIEETCSDYWKDDVAGLSQADVALLQNAQQRVKQMFFTLAEEKLQQLLAKEQWNGQMQIQNCIDTGLLPNLKALHTFLKNYRSSLMQLPLFKTFSCSGRQQVFVKARSMQCYERSSLGAEVQGYLQFIGKCPCSMNNLPKAIYMGMRSEHWENAKPSATTYDTPTSFAYFTTDMMEPRVPTRMNWSTYEYDRYCKVQRTCTAYYGPYSFDSLLYKREYKDRTEYLQTDLANTIRPPANPKYMPRACIVSRIQFPFVSGQHPDYDGISEEQKDKNRLHYHGGKNFDTAKSDLCNTLHPPLEYNNILTEFWKSMDYSWAKSDACESPQGHTQQYNVGVEHQKQCLYLHLNGCELKEHVTNQAPNEGVSTSSKSSGRTKQFQYADNSTGCGCKRIGNPVPGKKGVFAVSYPAMIHEAVDDSVVGSGNTSLLPVRYIGLKRATCIRTADIQKQRDPSKHRKVYVGMAHSPVALWLEPSYNCYMKHWHLYLAHWESTLTFAADQLQADQNFDVLAHIDSQGYYDPENLEAECSEWSLEKGIHHCVMGFACTVAATYEKVKMHAGFCTGFGIPEPPCIMLHKLVLLIEVLERVELRCLRNKVDLDLWPITPAIDMIRSYESALKAATVHCNHKDTVTLFHQYNTAGWPDPVDQRDATDTMTFWHPIPLQSFSAVHFERLMQLYQVAANHMAAIKLVAHAKSKDVDGSLYERHQNQYKNGYFTTVHAVDTAGVADAHASIVSPTTSNTSTRTNLDTLHFQDPRKWQIKDQLECLSKMSFDEICTECNTQREMSKENTAKATLICELFMAGITARQLSDQRLARFIDNQETELGKSVANFLQRSTE